MMEVRAVIRAI